MTPAAFWRRTLWNQVGPLDVQYNWGFDWEWFIRASQKTTFNYVSAYLASYRLLSDIKTLTGGWERCKELAQIACFHGGWLQPTYLAYQAERINKRFVSTFEHSPYPVRKIVNKLSSLPTYIIQRLFAGRFMPSVARTPQEQEFYFFLDLANCYSAQGKYIDAEERLNNALSIEGVPDLNKVFAHYNLGSMYERKGDYRKAKEKFETVLALSKEVNSSERKKLSGNAHFHLGCIYQNLSEKEKLKRNFKTA